MPRKRKATLTDESEAQIPSRFSALFSGFHQANAALVALPGNTPADDRVLKMLGTKRDIARKLAAEPTANLKETVDKVTALLQIHIEAPWDRESSLSIGLASLVADLNRLARVE